MNKPLNKKKNPKTINVYFEPLSNIISFNYILHFTMIFILITGQIPGMSLGDSSILLSNKLCCLITPRLAYKSKCFFLKIFMFKPAEADSIISVPVLQLSVEHEIGNT